MLPFLCSEAAVAARLFPIHCGGSVVLAMPTKRSFAAVCVACAVAPGVIVVAAADPATAKRSVAGNTS